MIGRLIRSEEDRGIVAIVEARPDRPYFQRLAEALPEGCAVHVRTVEELADVMAEVLTCGGSAAGGHGRG